MGSRKKNKGGLQVLYGYHSVYHALHSDRRRIHQLFLQEGQKVHRLQKILDLAKIKSIPIAYQPRTELQRRCGSPNHQGVVGEAAAFPLSTVEDLLKHRRDERPACILALDGIQDPRNLGSIIRSAHALGVYGIIIPKDRSCGLTPAVARVSEGALEYSRISQVVNLAREMRAMKKQGFWLIGMHTHGGEFPDAVDLKGDIIIILGGEDRGIRRIVMEQCDQIITIPIGGPVGSLNASNAMSILLYEVDRQRRNR